MAKLSEQIKQKEAGKRRGRATRTERELARFKTREARKKRAKELDKRLEKAGSVEQMEKFLENVPPEVKKYLENTPEKARQKVQTRKQKLDQKIQKAKERRKRELRQEEEDIERAEEDDDWEEEQQEEKEYDVEEAYWDEYIQQLKKNRNKINTNNLQVTVKDVEDVADEYADYEEEKEEREEEAKLQRERAKREREKKIEETLNVQDIKLGGEEGLSKKQQREILGREALSEKAQKEFNLSEREFFDKPVEERKKLRKKAQFEDMSPEQQKKFAQNVKDINKDLEPIYHKGELAGFQQQEKNRFIPKEEYLEKGELKLPYGEKAWERDLSPEQQKQFTEQIQEVNKNLDPVYRDGELKGFRDTQKGRSIPKEQFIEGGELKVPQGKEKKFQDPFTGEITEERQSKIQREVIARGEQVKPTGLYESLKKDVDFVPSPTIERKGEGEVIVTDPTKGIFEKGYKRPATGEEKQLLKEEGVEVGKEPEQQEQKSYSQMAISGIKDLAKEYLPYAEEVSQMREGDRERGEVGDFVLGTSRKVGKKVLGGLGKGIEAGGKKVKRTTGFFTDLTTGYAKMGGVIDKETAQDVRNIQEKSVDVTTGVVKGVVPTTPREAELTVALGGAGKLLGFGGSAVAYGYRGLKGAVKGSKAFKKVSKPIKIINKKISKLGGGKAGQVGRGVKFLGGEAKEVGRIGLRGGAYGLAGGTTAYRTVTAPEGERAEEFGKSLREMGAFGYGAKLGKKSFAERTEPIIKKTPQREPQIYGYVEKQTPTQQGLKSQFSIYGERKPPVTVRRTTAFRERLGLRPLEPEYTQPAQKFIVQTPTPVTGKQPFPVVTAVEGRSRMGFSIIQGGKPQPFEPTSTLLSKPEQYAFRGLVERTRTGGRPVLQPSKFVSEDAQYMKGLSVGQKQFEYNPNTGTFRFPPRGKSTTQAVQVSEGRLLEDTATYQKFGVQTQFKDVTKPLARATGKTQPLKGIVYRKKGREGTTQFTEFQGGQYKSGTPYGQETQLQQLELLQKPNIQKLMKSGKSIQKVRTQARTKPLTGTSPKGQLQAKTKQKREVTKKLTPTQRTQQSSTKVTQSARSTARLKPVTAQKGKQELTQKSLTQQVSKVKNKLSQLQKQQPLQKTRQIQKPKQITRAKQLQKPKQLIKQTMRITPAKGKVPVRPPTTRTRLTPVPPIPELKGKVKKKVGKKKKKEKEQLYYIPDFTARAIGLEPKKVSGEKATQKAQKILTGLEVRRGLKVPQ